MRVSGPGLQAAHWEGARSLLPTGTPPSPGSPMLTLTLPGFWGSSLPLHSLEEALTRVRVTLAPTSSPNLLLHLPFSGPSLLPKLPETPALPELGPQRLLTTHGEPPSPQVSSLTPGLLRPLAAPSLCPTHPHTCVLSYLPRPRFIFSPPPPLCPGHAYRSRPSHTERGREQGLPGQVSGPLDERQ